MIGIIVFILGLFTGSWLLLILGAIIYDLENGGSTILATWLSKKF